MNYPSPKGNGLLRALRLYLRSAEVFWHAASIKSKQKLDILSCNNCVVATNSLVLNDTEREKCIYRAVKVNWIKLIIETYKNFLKNPVQKKIKKKFFILESNINFRRF